MSYDARLPFHRNHLPEGVGAALRRTREDWGASRREVASAAGIAARTLARIEREAQQPSWATLERLSAVLGISASSLAPRWVRDSVDLPTNPVSAPGIGLRALRRERGATLADLARAAAVSIATLSRFERGITASRLLAARIGGPDVLFDERDVVLDNDALANALGFRQSEALMAACVAAAGRAAVV